MVSEMDAFAGRKEWYVWRAMCSELQRLGVDIIEKDELTRLIREWGDRLADCRIENPDFGKAKGD